VITVVIAAISYNFMRQDKQIIVLACHPKIIVKKCEIIWIVTKCS
jgi:hypothetical protein